MLEAKQRFNQGLLQARGRPTKEVVLDYARAALDAEAFEVAAEMFMAAERIDPSENHASNICYAMDRAGKKDRSSEWARIAYKRSPDALTAYNLSCGVHGEENERLLRESLSLNPSLTCTLLALGRLLMRRGDAQGERCMEKAIRLMDADLRRHALRKQDCRRLIEAAREMGNDEVADRAQARLDSMVDGRAYEEGNLAASMDGQRQISEG
jgi:tetratricopeptide (TPR) repeat protein